jgi:hypothetical protein
MLFAAALPHPSAPRWRLLVCWLLALVVPLQGMAAAMLQAQGPRHVHRAPAVQAKVHPAGFEWAGAQRLKTTPSTADVIAAIRANAHGSRQRQAAPPPGPIAHAGAHAHAHASAQRHFHAPGDASVVHDEASDAPRDVQVAHPAMAWAPPGPAARPALVGATDALPAHRSAPWRSRVAPLPERPPRPVPHTA